MSFKDVREGFRITVDTSVENAIFIHLGDGSVMNFKEVASGLYLLCSSNYTKQKLVHICISL